MAMQETPHPTPLGGKAEKMEPFRLLIEAANGAYTVLGWLGSLDYSKIDTRQESERQRAIRELRAAIAAAERALDEAEPPAYGSETPATHYLPAQIDALRLADELSCEIQDTGTTYLTRWILDKARAYRKKRGLEGE